MTETEARKILLKAYPKDELRRMYKKGTKHINVPIITGSTFDGSYQNHGDWKFSIIELLS